MLKAMYFKNEQIEVKNICFDLHYYQTVKFVKKIKLSGNYEFENVIEINYKKF